MPAEQLALSFEYRPALGRDDFIVARGNAEAVAWIDRWPDWPSHGLVLYGAPGSGKTHLTAVWQAKSGARALGAGDLGADPPACALIDGAEAMLAAHPQAEEPLFHLWNAAVRRRGFLLLTGARHPRLWPVALADLASRLRALPAVEIGAPDEALLFALADKLFRDRGLAVSADVIGYVVPRLERSGAALRAAVDRIDRVALAAHRRVTVPLARQALGLGQGELFDGGR
jgi:chromosomal replication initiation ATPase DnaA